MIKIESLLERLRVEPLKEESKNIKGEARAMKEQLLKRNEETK